MIITTLFFMVFPFPKTMFYSFYWFLGLEKDVKRKIVRDSPNYFWWKMFFRENG